MEEQRDKRNQEKLQQMTNLYFQNEFNLLKSNQTKSKDRQVYYSDDYSRIHEIPEDRL